MALSIKDIIDRNFFPGTVLMTGRESAGNLVGWVNVQEILDSTDMVQPGELLLTTGYDLGDFRQHQNLIPRMKSRGVVGMMIQTGYYQESVPVYLLEAGRKYHFPILELPAKYSFSEVLRTLITEISKDGVLDNQIFARSNEVLQTLLRKDREGDGDYLHTLRILIEEQGNITKTAKRLFVHRHTLQNRLQLIWDLTGMDYEDYFSRLFLSLSLLIYDYYAV